MGAEQRHRRREERDSWRNTQLFRKNHDPKNTIAASEHSNFFLFIILINELIELFNKSFLINLIKF